MSLLRILGIALWSVAVGSGLLVLTNYSVAPGVMEPGKADWPQDTQLQLKPSGHTMLVFLHPHCPCSHATVNELSRLLADTQQQVHAQAVFFGPENRSETWSRTRLWHNARRATGVDPVVDVGAVESDRFGAISSGHVCLYSSSGERLFHGGITSSRGHECSNLATRSLTQILRCQQLVEGRFPVFGCKIANETPFDVTPIDGPEESHGSD